MTGRVASQGVLPARGATAVRRGLALLLSILLTGGLLTALAAPAQAGAGEDLLARTNAARSAAGLAPLKMNGALVGVAASWSQKMANADAMSHNPSMSSQIPGGWSAAAENVAWNRPASVAGLHTAWMNSPGHRTNILNPAFTDVGMAVVVKDGKAWGTQVFAAYGKPAAQSAPKKKSEPKAKKKAEPKATTKSESKPAAKAEPAPKAAPKKEPKTEASPVAATPSPTATPTPTPTPTLTPTATPVSTPTPTPSPTALAVDGADDAASSGGTMAAAVDRLTGPGAMPVLAAGGALLALTVLALLRLRASGRLGTRSDRPAPDGEE